MSGAFDLPVDPGQDLTEPQLGELILWHRGYGLKAGFLNSEACITANGDAGVLMTEILRLALIGLRCRHLAPASDTLRLVIARANDDFRRSFS